MKSNHEQDRSQDRVLREWVVDAPMPPRFQEQVWQRISRTKARPEPTFRAALAQFLEVVLPRPKFALAYLAVLLAVGMAGGSLAAQIKSNRLDAALSQRYVQSIDPYQAETPNP